MFRVLRNIATRNRASFSSEAGNLKKTCLFDFHEKNGGKMVDFAGYLMPVQYSDLSIIASHLHTRKFGSIFDVSHMLQLKIHGKDRVEFIESLTVGDIKGLNDDQGTLTLFTNNKGGIIDDLIVSKTSQGCLYVVCNAGCAEKDQDLLESAQQSFRNQGKDVAIEVINSEFGLLALQGPQVADALQKVTEHDLANQFFMETRLGTVCGVENCRITRCGYTGEDGFELSIPSDRIDHVASVLLGDGNIKLAGLGARDTLRLEAGLCLYGNEMDEATTPIEATLAWTIAKRRRELANFPGASIILRQLKEKPLRKRVGIKAIAPGPPARGHTNVIDIDSNEPIGYVTSGCPSPSIGSNIGMAYVSLSHTKLGSKILCEIRKKTYSYEVSKMPFVQAKYYNAPKKV